MGFGYDIVVTITGVVLVFFILVLLMLIITLEGKIFDAIAAKKKAQADAVKAAAKAAQPAAPVQAAAAPAPEAPEVEEGIPGDVIAAIMAAIYAMGNGKYTLRAVRRADKGSWSRAGINESTNPF